MKIIYNETTGEITSCALDSVVLEGSITVADNIEVFQNIAKYLYVGSAFILKPYLVCTPQLETAVVNTNITIDVVAKKADGSTDTDCVCEVVALTLPGVVLSTFNMVAGEGSFTVTSDMPKQVYVIATSPAHYSTPAMVTFTVA